MVLGCGLFGFLAAKEKILAVAADFDPSLFVTVWCGSASLFHGYLAASKHSHWIQNSPIDALDKWFGILCFRPALFSISIARMDSRLKSTSTPRN